MGPLYVVSDVHGHRDDLAHGLRSAGLLDENGRWTGGDAQLWVLGDLTDRGPDGIGVVNLVRGLQAQAPEQVHVLMGNHEILALGRARFPKTRFAGSWRANGGLARDQAGLTEDDLAWLAGLPVAARVGDELLVHSDTLEYLSWGDSVEEINATVTALLDDGGFLEHWDVWARLTSRYDFAGDEGPGAARRLLDSLGGERIVHGHSIIGSLLGVRSTEVRSALLYAEGLVLAIDGGRYDGGPLLVVRLR
jgi:hypothetical protein